MLNDAFERLKQVNHEVGKDLGAVFKAAFVLVESGRLELQVFIKAADRLLEMANHEMIDPLTGLWNRRYFDLQLVISREKYLRNEIGQLSLIIFDLDGLKVINDNSQRGGHAAGDRALRGLGEILLGPHYIGTSDLSGNRQRDEQVLRESDIVCRLGGDEFGVILPNTDIAVAAKIAERTRHNIEKQSLSKSGVYFTASLGVVQLKRFENVERFVKRADEALYQAKHLGKNQVTVATS